MGCETDQSQSSCKSWLRAAAGAAARRQIHRCPVARPVTHLRRESLTPEQEAQFPGWVEKWTKIGLSTEPADRPKAMTAVRGLYRQSSLDQVPLAWVSSPIVGALAASLLSVIVPGMRKIFSELDEKFELEPLDIKKEFYAEPGRIELDQLASEKFAHSRPRTLENVSDDWVPCDDVWVVHAVDTIVNAVMQAEYLPRLNAIAKANPEQANVVAVTSTLQISALMRDTMMKEQLEWHAWYGGQFWCAFAAWATFFRDVLKVSVPQIEHEANLCESAGYIWPNEGFCLICERPRRLTVVQDRLDDEEGPAMEYPDGCSFRSAAASRRSHLDCGCSTPRASDVGTARPVRSRILRRI